MNKQNKPSQNLKKNVYIFRIRYLRGLWPKTWIWIRIRILDRDSQIQNATFSTKSSNSLNNNNSKHMKKYYLEHPAFQFFAIFSRDSNSAVIFWFILILNFASGCKLCMQACREWQKNQNTHFYKREKDQNCASITIVRMRSSRAVRASGYCNLQQSWVQSQHPPTQWQMKQC